MEFTFLQLCESIGYKKHMGMASISMTTPIHQVVIDSRKVKKNDVFFAFKGETLDGEQFAQGAIDAGALAVVVSKTYAGDEHPRILKVDNVQWALQELARAYAKVIDVPIVAISGSVGKTSTKDMIGHVLSSQLKVFKTQGNFNNELGLPLMLLSMDSTYDIAILEMGMNHAGELARLVEIARPKLAILTNIGTAHIEFFGSKEGIFHAKMELASQLSDQNCLIVNGTDTFLRKVAMAEEPYPGHAAYKVLSVGVPGDRYWATEVVIEQRGTRFILNSNLGRREILLPLLGKHHVLNALLALGLVDQLGLDFETAIEALASVPTTKMRFEAIYDGNRTWINDAYNASLDSIVAAVETLCQMSCSPKWVVLGDVFECGDQSQQIHTEIGRSLNAFDLDGLIFIGESMVWASKAYQGNHYYFETTLDALESLQILLPHEGCILVKASRGMALEQIIEKFLECDVCTQH